ncbi:MAG: hypothetical protein WA210_23290 [Burkholderiaceae bacterium]
MNLADDWNGLELRRRAQRRARVAWLALLSLSAISGPQAAPAEAWQVAGEQGLVRLIIVPREQVRDVAAYARQVKILCEPQRSCFLNFYANPTNAPLVMPLPEAISNEATATFRRSLKQGAERFMWSCRLQIAPENCF